MAEVAAATEDGGGGQLDLPRRCAAPPPVEPEGDEKQAHPGDAAYPANDPRVIEHAAQPATDIKPHAAAPRAEGFLAGMRVRKKLIVLHTLFSLLLAGILAAALWPAINMVVEEAELHEGRLAIFTARALLQQRADSETFEQALARVAQSLPPGVRLLSAPLDADGLPSTGGIGGPLAGLVIQGDVGAARLADGSVAALWLDRERGTSLIAGVRLSEARGEVRRLYIFMTLALLAVYGLIALSLEVLVLPRHVYGPIRAMLVADRAVQENRREEELISPRLMPADELGEIMRSRNRTVQSLRTHEAQLARAVDQLAQTAGDLARKNHLLEAAQRNLADADRLASLGIMSAGLAHELNTPLAVIKGLVEQQQARPDRRLSGDEAALLLRVVARLERLSDSLLDFARTRPARLANVALGPLIDEAWTLVRLDREAARVELVNRVAPGSGALGSTGEAAPSLFPDHATGPALIVPCDGDRLLQVLINLLRNAVDAIESARRAAGTPVPPPGRIEIDAGLTHREGGDWLSITIADNGPGIDPDILGRLFEPFASTRLDSRGTGLGLAVSEGIIREHGGVLLARNREGSPGSVFEIVLPAGAPAPA
ncbi:MAG: sensor histidine kinase [Phycisphaerales bacterium]